MSDQFWSDLPSILFKQNRLSEFYITSDMTKVERLNAIVRFFIYTSILSVLYTNEPKYLLLIAIALIITYIINENSTENFSCDNPNGETGKLTNDQIVFGEDPNLDTVKPTIDNPFMNPSIFDDITKFKPQDYSDNTEKSNEVKKDIYNKFSANLFKDAGDIFDSNNSFREFYTVPNNVTNYSKFLQFIYGDFNKGTKESSYNGFKNQYDPLKSRRQIN
jgi:hypothetical protein